MKHSLNRIYHSYIWFRPFNDLTDILQISLTQKFQFIIKTSKLFCRSLIWRKDSSPEYIIQTRPVSERFLHTCNSNVDFPIPGSPPTNEGARTIPPPSTLSSSPIPPLTFVFFSQTDISDKLQVQSFSVTYCLLEDAVFLDETVSSTNVFHALHARTLSHPFG